MATQFDINYKEFVGIVAKRAGYLEYEVKDVIDKAILVLREQMQDGQSVKIDTLGKFFIKTMPSRTVKSKLLNGPTRTSPKRRVKFVASAVYERFLNNKGNTNAPV